MRAVTPNGRWSGIHMRDPVDGERSPGTRLDCVYRVGGRWVSPRLACRSAVHGQGYTFDAVLCIASELFRAYEVEVRPARRPAALRLAVRYAPVPR